MRFSCLVIALSIGCGGGNGGNEGEAGGPCHSNGTCNAGLTCAAGICVPSDAMPDAQHDAAIDAPIDAPSCSTAYEPNDTYQTASDTGVAAVTRTWTSTAAMLCPAGDKDHYAVTISAVNQNLEMILESDGAVVEGSILIAGGLAIANAVPVQNMPQRRRAYAAMLPVGTYYAQAFSSTTTVSNYTLTLTVTGP